MLNRVKAGVNGAGVIRAHKVKDRAFDSGQFFDFGPKAGGGGGAFIGTRGLGRKKILFKKHFCMAFSKRSDTRSEVTRAKRSDTSEAK